jgi:hypothetical protein
MPKKLLFPEDIVPLLRKRFSHQHQRWLAGETEGEGGWPQTFLLGAPTQADVASDFNATQAWAIAWRSWSLGGTVNWEVRQWPRLGQQELPIRLSFANAGEFAAAVQEQGRWAVATVRFAEMARRWPALVAGGLTRQFAALADYPEAEYVRLVALLGWLQSNPRSGLYLRQIPVEGMDTKWIAPRKSLIQTLARPLMPESESEDFETALGLIREPVRIRLRILCSRRRQALSGLGDLEAPIEQLVNLPLSPERIIIVENKYTGLALPDMEGTVAFFGLGNGVNVLSALPWLRSVPGFYWGDLDTHGFAILDLARRTLPGIKSVLMDEATLLAHRPLWGEEPEPYVGQDLAALNAEERAVFEGIQGDRWGMRIRLEQERISWPTALRELSAKN